jgi:hypothetical protein
MSYKPEVQTDASGKWYGNGLRFATYDEAYASASDLAGRWLLVREFRAVESDEPVNYRWDASVGLVRVEGAP